MDRRPMRPKPLIPTLIGIRKPLLCWYALANEKPWQLWNKSAVGTVQCFVAF
jgi:hypothetical protein